jgi:hypothetical protein
MTTGNKRKAAAADETDLPVTFAEINRRRVQERLENYREIVTKRAAGEALTVGDMERASELLDLLGLPGYTFDRHFEAMQRFNSIREKYDSAVAAVPANTQRAAELAVEIETLRKKLDAMREEQWIAKARASKPGIYSHTVKQLEHDHPHVLADIDTAVRVCIAELDRRKQIGGAA